MDEKIINLDENVIIFGGKRYKAESVLASDGSERIALLLREVPGAAVGAAPGTGTGSSRIP